MARCVNCGQEIYKNGSISSGTWFHLNTASEDCGLRAVPEPVENITQPPPDYSEERKD
jgi:hypothetical protein